VLLPYAHGTLGYRFGKGLEALIDIEGFSRSSDWMVDTVGMLNYWMGSQWNASVGYRYYGRKVRTADLKNEVVYEFLYLGISYSW
jgi:hypothetical protein